jgi:quercetin dioxygenase-like cupin family protein
MWADGAWSGDYKRGEVIGVKAGVVHIFEAQEDDTFLSCLTISEIAEMVRKEAV